MHSASNNLHLLDDLAIGWCHLRLDYLTTRSVFIPLKLAISPGSNTLLQVVQQTTLHKIHG